MLSCAMALSRSRFIAGTGVPGAASVRVRSRKLIARSLVRADSWRPLCPSGKRSRRNSGKIPPSPFPVLTDVDNGYALSLNLAIWIGPDLEDLLSSFGRLLPEYQGNNAWILPIPATFVVGRDGRISARFVDPDFRRRMSVEELIAALQTAP